MKKIRRVRQGYDRRRKCPFCGARGKVFVNALPAGQAICEACGADWHYRVLVDDQSGEVVGLSGVQLTEASVDEASVDEASVDAGHEVVMENAGTVWFAIESPRLRRLFEQVLAALPEYDRLLVARKLITVRDFELRFVERPEEFYAQAKMANSKVVDGVTYQGYDVILNGETLANASDEQARYSIAHELGHVFRDHPWQRDEIVEMIKESWEDYGDDPYSDQELADAVTYQIEDEADEMARAWGFRDPRPRTPIQIP